MSAEAQSWVWRHSPMTGHAFTVHLAIADSANDQHDYELWMRLPRLAAKTRMHPGTVRRAVADLIAAGLLEVLDDGRNEGKAGQARARRFRMLMPDGPVVYDTRPKPRQGRAENATQGSRTARDGSRSLRDGRAENATGRAACATDLEHKGNPSGEPKAENTLALAGCADIGGESFESFYDAYPRHVGKRAARAAWGRAVKRSSRTAVLEGARRLAADPNLPEPRYIPHPATWLNRDGWLDGPLPERTDRPRQSNAAAPADAWSESGTMTLQDGRWQVSNDG